LEGLRFLTESERERKLAQELIFCDLVGAKAGYREGRQNCQKFSTKVLFEKGVKRLIVATAVACVQIPFQTHNTPKIWYAINRTQDLWICSQEH
jgi:hypothetical protein